MPDPTPEQRLAALRRRWESERTPTASVSLAEEYRRQGRHADARAVLEEALKAFPQHLSALVALGRVRLESSDPAGAAQVLEKVLARDPMQLVANKMLAEAYLELGRPADAEQRIRIYALLNDRDPELVPLQRRLRQALAPATPAAPPTPPASPQPAAETVKIAVPVSLPVPAPLPAPVAAPVAPPAPRPAAPSGSGGEIFAGLAGAQAVARYQQGWSAGDVFGSPAGRAPSPVATATLGELYLRQGHHAEAEGIFTAVLRSEPWNETARAGLQAARTPPPLAAGASTDPRAARLRGYLERLRLSRETLREPDVR